MLRGVKRGRVTRHGVQGCCRRCFRPVPYWRRFGGRRLCSVRSWRRDGGRGHHVRHLHRMHLRRARGGRQTGDREGVGLVAGGRLTCGRASAWRRRWGPARGWLWCAAARTRVRRHLWLGAPAVDRGVILVATLFVAAVVPRAAESCGVSQCLPAAHPLGPEQGLFVDHPEPEEVIDLIQCELANVVGGKHDVKAFSVWRRLRAAVCTSCRCGAVGPCVRSGHRVSRLGRCRDLPADYVPGPALAGTKKCAMSEWSGRDPPKIATVGACGYCVVG